MKCFHRTLSGSHGRSFRICHEISLEAPLSEKITITLYLACNKTSYLGNHASRIESYFVSLSESHARFFRLRPAQSSEAPLGEEFMMTSYLACNKTLLSQKPCTPEKSCSGTLAGSYGRYFRIRHEKSREAPPGDQIPMTSYPACKIPRYLENHASQMKSYNG